MRKVLNVLQSTWLAYKNVTEDNVYTCVGHPLKTDIENIVKWLLNNDFQTTYKSILNEKVFLPLPFLYFWVMLYLYLLTINLDPSLFLYSLSNVSWSRYKYSKTVYYSVILFRFLGSFYYSIAN